MGNVINFPSQRKAKILWSPNSKTSPAWRFRVEPSVVDFAVLEPKLTKQPNNTEGNGMQETKRERYDEVIGITKQGEVFILETVFDHGNGFHGATGLVMMPVSEEEIDERNNIDHVKETVSHIWQEEVQAGHTEEGLTEFAENWLENELKYEGKDFHMQDDGGTHLIYDDGRIHEWFEENLGFRPAAYECVGAGRVFGRNVGWAHVLRPDLLEMVQRWEEERA